uniref:Uncharacterized protein n=1 Tax=Solanum tuberosum TaxID=4113 RepID=M1DUC6_SOLTU
MLNSDSEKSGSESSSDEGSSTSEDLKTLQQEDYITSEDECSPCQQGMACEKEDDEDDLYKIYAQFKELSLNVIDNDKKNPEGKIHGQEIIDLINVKISKYYDTATMEPQVIEDLSPFKNITRKLQMKKGLISKSEAIALYMEEVKKDLMRNLDINIKDDISMASASHTNEEDDTCAAGEGQDVDEEIDIEAILRNYQQQIEESSSTSTAGKGKEKA